MHESMQDDPIRLTIDLDEVTLAEYLKDLNIQPHST